MKHGIASLLLALVALSSTPALAKGRLKSISDTDTTPNWVAENPKIVVALGLLQPNLIVKYMDLARDLIQALPQPIAVKVQIDTIPMARGYEVVNALQDPNTVGLIVVGHSYTAKLGTILLGADGLPFPSALISAATPALRFVAFLACHGDKLVQHFQAKHEIQRLAGKQTVFYSTDRYLGTGRKSVLRLIGYGTVYSRMKDIAQLLPQLDLLGGVPAEQPTGRLRLSVKDVRPGIEPRFVYLNSRIVGVLGGEKGVEKPEPSAVVEYPVHAWTLRPEARCQSTMILSSELTPGAPVDDYMISSVELESNSLALRKTYDSPVHVGDDQAPGPLVDVPPTPLTKKEAANRDQYQKWAEKMAAFVRSAEWLDRDPANWSPLKGRIFSDCLK